MQQQNKASAQAITATSLPAIPPPPKQWHASQIAAPDPCNSTIKRISGKQIYLKDKPQALILLQAAEIQRLTCYLNDYKCKFRTLAKEPLDRQSYQVQIKELFERDANNKVEIERLNKIIVTMTVTGEQYKRQVLSAQEKYKLAINERDALGERNIYIQRQLQNTRENFDRFIKKSQSEIYSLNNQLASHKTYTESVLKNNADLVARVNTISIYQRRIFQLETQIIFYLQQSQRMNKDLETKTEKLINQERGYSTLYERHKTLQKSHEDLKIELDSHAKGLEAHKKEAESKSTKLKAKHQEEIGQHSEILTKREALIEELQKSIHDMERALHASKGQLKLSQQIIKTQEIENEKLKKQQEELKAASAERESLSRSIKEKTSTINQLQKSLKQQKEKQAEIATKNSKLQEQHDDLKRRFAEENMSLNKMINNKVTESESLKRQLINNEQELRSQFENNFEAQTKAHDQKIAKIHEQKQAVSDAHEGLKAEHIELKTKHGDISQEKQQIEKKYGQLSIEYKSLKAKTIQLEKSIEQYTLKIAELTKIHDLLKRYFEEASQNNDQLLQKLANKQLALQTSQNEISKQKQELNLLRGTTIRLKSERSCFQLQIYELKQQVTKLKSDITKMKEQIAQKESQIAKVKGEREQLSQLFQGKTKEGQGLKRKMIELQTELRESFEIALKQKEDTHNQAYKTLSQEHGDLSKEKDKIQAQKETILTMSTEYQARIALLLQEIDRLHTIVNSTIAQSKLDLEQAKISGAAQQTQITTLTQQLEDSQKRQQEITTKYTILTKRVTSYEETLQNIRSQLIKIQLRTGQLRQERDLLIKKNAILVKSIHTLSTELNSLEKQGDSIAAFFTKESAIHKELTSRFTTLQDLLNTLQSEKWTFEEKTIEITQVASQ